MNFQYCIRNCIGVFPSDSWAFLCAVRRGSAYQRQSERHGERRRHKRRRPSRVRRHQRRSDVHGDQSHSRHYRLLAAESVRRRQHPGLLVRPAAAADPAQWIRAYWSVAHWTL